MVVVGTQIKRRGKTVFIWRDEKGRFTRAPVRAKGEYYRLTVAINRYSWHNHYYSMKYTQYFHDRMAAVQAIPRLESMLLEKYQKRVGYSPQEMMAHGAVFVLSHGINIEPTFRRGLHFREEYLGPCRRRRKVWGGKIAK